NWRNRIRKRKDTVERAAQCIVPYHASNQSIVGSMVIDAEFGREDHSSIPRNCNREGTGTT
ncbi:hypothetical protein A2U01_0001627, partial [Trifolium medium]|nr:hypothetical protein [Trifolium medium]